MEQTATAAKSGFPWAIIMIVGLLIAKFGFGVQISWLWVLAPFWIPLALVLGILAVIAVCYALFVLVVFFATAVGAFFRKRRQRRTAW